MFFYLISTTFCICRYIRDQTDLNHVNNNLHMLLII
uniref:Uncharacterized protein n=1 Tax=Arundo donax TaxID=35708 RepID=A0A0A9ESR1_ARUDO